jgi:hypothetical protein
MTKQEVFRDAYLAIYIAEDKSNNIELTNARLAKLVQKADVKAKQDCEA